MTAQEKLQHQVATQREATEKLDQIKTNYFGTYPAKAKERLQQAEEDNKRERQQENREHPKSNLDNPKWRNRGRRRYRRRTRSQESKS